MHPEHLADQRGTNRPIRNRHFLRWGEFLVLCLFALLPPRAGAEQLPFVAWNTFFGVEGTSLSDVALDLAADPQGNIYVVGRSDGTWGDPLAPWLGFFDPMYPKLNAFVAKFDADGNLIWNTFLPDLSTEEYGEWLNEPLFITWAPRGRVCVAGTTLDVAFAACLSGDGDLLWSKEIASWPTAIVAGEDGTLYLSGTSWGDPVRGWSDKSDAYVTALDRNGNLLWTTFLGGAEEDYGWGIALGSGGAIYVTGTSLGDWGEPVHPRSIAEEIFVARLDHRGNLVWNTFLGGRGHDQGLAIAVDQQSNLFVAGSGRLVPWDDPLGEPTREFQSVLVKLDTSGATCAVASFAQRSFNMSW